MLASSKDHHHHQKDWSTRVKITAWKPLCLHRDSNNDQTHNPMLMLKVDRS
jgi:hypothetical protein